MPPSMEVIAGATINNGLPPHHPPLYAGLSIQPYGTQSIQKPRRMFVTPSMSMNVAPSTSRSVTPNRGRSATPFRSNNATPFTNSNVQADRKAIPRLNVTRELSKFVRNTGKGPGTTRCGLMIRRLAGMTLMMCVRMFKNKEKFQIVGMYQLITVSMFLSLTAKMSQKRCAPTNSLKLVKMSLRKYAKFSITRFLSE